ncbi:hypothetical protein AAFF_G00167440 [Aldrovandia affinis]|uniref:Fibronectin type-III domain-containing protein n=1 Tax=Aldrovandia affinis TaxID=143900 RepID=A0AAD7RMJ4_9TELE|nr:hypothetical protein AAFF_G00167440 [Aldrovandia affinis]
MVEVGFHFCNLRPDCSENRHSKAKDNETERYREGTFCFQVMKCILFTIFLILHCCHALGALPAPANVTIDSRNFEHILRWRPGPGTPLGTTYKVNFSKGKQLLVRPRYLNSSVTMVNLTRTFKQVTKQYTVHVRALNGDTESPWSNQSFCPFTDTVLGPPEVSVVGCGGCLLLKITLPRGRANKTIVEIYNEFVFSIFWKRPGESQVQKVTTTLNQHKINDLHRGVEYCVQVHPEQVVNPNILSSDWTCSFTDPPTQNLVPGALATVSVVVVLAGVVLFGLVYGFLCNPNTSLPMALTFLVQYSVSVADPVPDPISVISERGERALGQGESEGQDEEEEDDGNDGYETRAARLSRGTSSSSGTSGAVTGSATPLTGNTSTSGDSGSCRPSDTTTAEWGDPLTVGLLDQSEKESDGERAETGPSKKVEVVVEVEEEEEEEGLCVDVNLFSVTLGAQEQEEEEGSDDEWWTGGPRRRNSTDERRPLASVETREGEGLRGTEAHAANPPSQSERGKTHSLHYLQTRCDSTRTDAPRTLEESEEEEEEEEEDERCSDYMTR